MYLLRVTPTPADPKGNRAVLEATPDVLDYFLAACSKEGSQASRDAALFTLAKGLAELRGNDGTAWSRVHKPMMFTPQPTVCQITNKRLGPVMYDGKTRNGPWAIMCEEAWEAYGCGRLGAGFGQKYRRSTEGGFYLSEGWTNVPRPYRVNAA